MTLHLAGTLKKNASELAKVQFQSRIAYTIIIITFLIQRKEHIFITLKSQ